MSSDKKGTGRRPDGTFDFGNKPVAGATEGNTRSLQHGAKSPHIVGPLAETKLAEVEKLCTDTPAGSEAFSVARQALALKLARLQLVRDYIDRTNAGSYITKKGSRLKASETEIKLLESVEKSLEVLGLTPLSAGKLGIDLARQADIGDQLAKARRTRKRIDRKAIKGVSTDG